MMANDHTDFDGIPPDVPVVPPSDQKTLEWIAVLSAAGLDYRLSCDDGRWIIHLPYDRAIQAMTEIELYEMSEARIAATPPPPTPPVFRFTHDVHATLWAVAFVAGCYILFGAATPSNRAVLTGAADSARICAGEWWRVVTALMLHADASHLAGNIFGLLFLGYLTCRVMGPGLGWFLILVAGSLGNAAKAVFADSYSVSLGASTAVFGALGILASYRVTQLFVVGGHNRAAWSRAWIPLGAGLAILSMWGSHPGSDLFSHMTGFVSGLFLAVPFSIREFDWMKGRVQTFLEWTSVAVVVGAWGLAGML